MPELTFHCPYCDTIHRVPPTMVGKQARCRCGKVVQVPREGEQKRRRKKQPETSARVDGSRGRVSSKKQATNEPAKRASNESPALEGRAAATSTTPGKAATRASLRCPRCKTLHQVTAAMAGTRAKCRCGAVLKIPESIGKKQQADGSAAVKPSQRTIPPRRRSTDSPSDSTQSPLADSTTAKQQKQPQATSPQRSSPITLSPSARSTTSKPDNDELDLAPESDELDLAPDSDELGLAPEEEELLGPVSESVPRNVDPGSTPSTHGLAPLTPIATGTTGLTPIQGAGITPVSIESPGLTPVVPATSGLTPIANANAGLTPIQTPDGPPNSGLTPIANTSGLSPVSNSNSGETPVVPVQTASGLTPVQSASQPAPSGLAPLQPVNTTTATSSGAGLAPLQQPSFSDDDLPLAPLKPFASTSTGSLAPRPQSGGGTNASCPICGNHRPLGLYTAHYVYSIVVMTYWGDSHRVSCRSCGMIHMFRQLLLNLMFGWWGFPFGLFLTPIQTGRTLFGLIRGPDPVRVVRE